MTSDSRWWRATATAPTRRNPDASELVTDRAQQIPPGCHVIVGFDAQRWLSVDHARDAAAERRGRRRRYRPDWRWRRRSSRPREPLIGLRTFTGNPSRTKITKVCPAANRQRIAHRQFDKLGIIPAAAHQSRTGRLTEGQPEPQRRTDPHHGLVQVLHRLDEVRLPDDDVEVVGLVDGHHVPGQRRCGHTSMLPPSLQRLDEKMPGIRLIPGTFTTARAEPATGTARGSTRCQSPCWPTSSCR